MRGYARKIRRTRWSSKNLATEEIPADALHQELETSANALSFWKVDSAEAEWWRAPALALAATRERLDDIEVAYVKADEEVVTRLVVREVPGETPVTDLIDHHVDVMLLDVGRIAGLATAIQRSFVAQWRKLTRREVKEMLRAAILDKRVERSRLQAGLLRSLDLGEESPTPQTGSPPKTG